MQIGEGGTFCPSCGWQDYAQGPPASVGADPTMRMLLPVGRSVYAIIAGYLGLISVLLIPAPFALLTGILAMRDIQKHPHKGGRGRAIFGIIMGAVFSLCLIAVFIWSLLPFFL